MHYLVVSYSHKNCDIATREKLAFPNDIQVKILKEFSKSPYISESALLATCNRVEAIISTKSPSDAQQLIYNIFSSNSDLDKDELEGRSEVFEDSGAVKHLLGVASALESVVVGEAQITGQLKEAYKMAKENNTCGRKLTRLIEHSFKCAANVRNETDIGRNPISVSSAAVVKAKELMGGCINGKDVLIFGAGEMAVLAAKHLVQAGTNIVMIGRDVNKTEEIARDIDKNIKVASARELPKYLNSYELFFSATGAPHPVINNDLVEKKDFDRYWFDIAVPRDIDEILDPRINVYSVDDLKDIVQLNLELRNSEASKAFKVVGNMTEEFYTGLKVENANPIIKAMRESAQIAAQEEIERAIAKKYIPEESRENIEKLVHNAFKKFLHKPTITIKDYMKKPEAEEITNTINLLFKKED